MAKKNLIICAVILAILGIIIVGWDLYVEEEAFYISCEFLVPIFNKRDVITLKSGKFFDDEKLEKIYLSEGQAKMIRAKIENNSNWKTGKLDEKLTKIMKRYTREDIYNNIPYVENKYWIFTNRSNGAKDKHSIEEVISDLYYSVSFALFDIDNKILYYYEYDR